MTEVRSVDEVVEIFRERLGDAIKEIKIKEGKAGAKHNRIYHDLYIRLDRKALRQAVRLLDELQKYPHLTVISGVDLGEEIELLYHFNLYYTHRHKEIMTTICVGLPKSDPKVDTITDIVPGAIWQEREKMEMLGIEVVNIPDSRRLLLPEDFPEGVYPWRRDEKGADHLTKKLWEV